MSRPSCGALEAADLKDLVEPGIRHQVHAKRVTLRGSPGRGTAVHSQPHHTIVL